MSGKKGGFNKCFGNSLYFIFAIAAVLKLLSRELLIENLFFQNMVPKCNKSQKKS